MSTPFALSSALANVAESAWQAPPLDRSTLVDERIWRETESILAHVRRDGDSELRRLALEFDDAKLDSLEVSRGARRRALDSIDPDLREAYERSVQNVAAVHRAFLPEAVEVQVAPGA